MLLTLKNTSEHEVVSFISFFVVLAERFNYKFNIFNKSALFAYSIASCVISSGAFQGISLI